MTTLLDAIKVELTISREALIREAERVPDHLFDERPSAEEWSSAEILDHVAATERRVSALFENSIAGAPATDVNHASDPTAVVSSVERLLAERAAGPLKSGHVPARGLTKAQAFDALASTRAALFQMVDRADGIDLSRITRPHPILGDLDMHQFLLFVARHEDRHRAQLVRHRDMIVP